ncbi:DUF3147 family protein [Francisellaceae bacterium]|nr:DUF3147 family protein [Francisellaceae bacterium]
MLYIYKIVITSVLVVIISEVSKRSSIIGAILASLPLISILAMIWLYVGTKSTEQVAALSMGVFWLVIPSLLFFLSLPYFLKKSISFWVSMGLSLGITVCGYFIMLGMMNFFGYKI